MRQTDFDSTIRRFESSRPSQIPEQIQEAPSRNSANAENKERIAEGQIPAQSNVTLFGPMDLAIFWYRVEGSTPLQCWPWRGKKNGLGYGSFRGQGTHRLAYELIKGPIPEGLVIRHSCDNPVCCNPEHLLPGTQADNIADAVERKRTVSGERVGTAKLTAEQAAYIRTNPDGFKQATLARRFGICNATVSYIRSGKIWKGAAS